ncbi:hypothetical protein [Vibrio vulnificus]|uniref:hypothetical protein n=1 Tax=Vibrio vulnificus TaxID=672 RepID=UPI001CDC1D92|nr:hypothetical protein [Vibrio vulnificus]EIV8497176.1 hypothetical protein [Vibrio vulnificus]ELV8675310.1 hypothetical protein [Vibrio vulnificus]MCA3944898.1 hypothetical protein [Vibrio vulnificus]
MKVALCFYGLVGSRADKDGKGIPLDPTIAYNLNYENIIKDNDVDVFIHSWSKEFESELVELYKPKSHLIEAQISFPQSKKIANNRDTSEKIRNMIQWVKSPSKIQSSLENNQKEAFRAYSRWYSNKQVLELKSKYEHEHNFKYDCVMVLRLDVGFYSKLDFSQYDMSAFHASNWNDYPTEKNNYEWNKENHNIGKGFLDFWFFSNSDNMDKFSRLYDNIDKYHVCPHRSAYQHVSTFTGNINYTMFRWNDFEMIRRKEFKSEL